MLFFIVLISLLSCGTAREKQVYRQAMRTDSLSVERHDSLQMRNILHSLSRQRVQISRVTFSPPDSSHRQYVEAITVLNSVSQQEQEEDTHTETIATETIRHTRASESKEEEQVRTNRFSTKLKLAAGLTIALILFFFGFRYLRHLKWMKQQ